MHTTHKTTTPSSRSSIPPNRLSIVDVNHSTEFLKEYNDNKISSELLTLSQSWKIVQPKNRAIKHAIKYSQHIVTLHLHKTTTCM